MAATIPFNGGDYGSVAISDNAVWATDGGPDVTKVDPETNNVADTVAVGGHIHSLVAGSGALWVSTSDGGGSLAQVSLVDDTLKGSVAAPTGSLQYADGTVWIFDVNTAVQVDANTMALNDLVLPVEGPSVLAGGSIWSISQSTADAEQSAVDTISVATGDIVDELPVPRAAAISADATGVWVLSATGSTSENIYLPDPKNPAFVTLIDPSTATQEAEPLSVDITPARIAAGEGAFWISHYETGKITKIEPIPTS